MNKDKIETKIKSLLHEKVTIVNRIKFSPNHISDYVKYTGKLNNYDLGDSLDGVTVEIIIEVTVGKKVPRVETRSLMVDSRDIVELSS